MNKKIFYKMFAGKSKAKQKDFYNVTFIEINEESGNVYERAVFVEKETFETIEAKKFKFGDEIELVTAPPAFFGASERLVDLNLVEESPFM